MGEPCAELSEGVEAYDDSQGKIQPAEEEQRGDEEGGERGR